MNKVAMYEEMIWEDVLEKEAASNTTLTAANPLMALRKANGRPTNPAVGLMGTSTLNVNSDAMKRHENNEQMSAREMIGKGKNILNNYRDSQNNQILRNARRAKRNRERVLF